MTSADEAFDSLMDKKALTIPVANPLENVEPEYDMPAPGNPADAMRVASLLDDEPEYNPPVDNENGICVTPTETDLKPVDAAENDENDGDEVDNAQLHGARIAGRDAGPPKGRC